MIFVTVGTQLPFERLIRSMDEWAAAHQEEPVIAQVGMTVYQPQHMQVVTKLDPVRYQEHFSQSRLVVSHVGMGTIISGLESAKPLVLMPRLANLGEHRNDHQVGTATKFQHFQNIHIVESPETMFAVIDRILKEELVEEGAQPLTLSPRLAKRLGDFVQEVKFNQLKGLPNNLTEQERG